MDVVSILNNSMPLLTDKQKGVVRRMLDNPDEMCYISLREFSQKAGCTEATVIRFCQRIGFTSFSDLKGAFRNVVRRDYKDGIESNRIIRSTPRNRSMKARYVTELRELERDSVNQTLGNIDFSMLETIARLILKSKTVHVLGRGPSYSIGDFFRRRLCSLGIRTYVINVEDAADLLASLHSVGQSDLFFFVTYPLYYTPLINIARDVKEKGASVIAFTDVDTSPITPLCDHYLATGALPRNLYYYSYAMPMACFNILMATLQTELKQNLDQVMQRNELISEMDKPDFSDALKVQQ